MRDTFCKVTGLTPGDPEWHQACRGLRHAYLGLRQTGLHAPAAYTCSVAASGRLAQALDGAWCQVEGDMAEVDAALAALNATLPP